MDLQCLSSVKEAIDALSNPQKTKTANEWLIQFEKSPDAWVVSERMLHETNQTYGFFGAKFLYSKIQKQAILLNENQKSDLQATLSEHIIRIATHFKTDSQQLRYLCLCLSALALQMNDSRVIQATLNRLNPLVAVHSMTLVTFLTVLPEEVFNGQIDVGSNVRDDFLLQLSTSSNDVLNFLSTLWGPHNSPNERCKMIKCLANWIDITTIPMANVVQHRIYLDCMASLNAINDELLDQSVELLLVLIRRYQSHHMDELVHMLIPQIVTLKTRWDRLESRYSSIRSEDVDESYALEAYALSKLFTETSEYCIEIFLNVNNDFGQNMLLYLLVHCCNYPFDHNVSRTPHKFFYDLSLLLKGNDDSTSDQLKTFYSNIYSELLLVAVNRLVFNVESDDNDRSLSDERNDWKEVVLDCQDVIGADGCFQILCSQLHMALATLPVAWSRIEAILFAIAVIFPKISDHVSSAAVEDLIKLCCSTPRGCIPLQTTCISLLGKLSASMKGPNFSNIGSQLFENLLSFLTEEKLSVSASVAVLSASRSNFTWLNVDRLIERLEDIRQRNSSLPHEVELNLIESVCCNINSVNEIKQKEVCGNLIAGIHSHLSQGISAANAKLVVLSLDKLAVISKMISSVTLLSSIFTHFWPVFQQIFTLVTKESIAEKTCKCLKHFIRGCKEEIAWVLPTLAENLAKSFAMSGYSAFLYCAGICVSTFGPLHHGKYHQIIYTLVWSLSGSFFLRFGDMASFEQQPDIVEEYFYMFSKVLQFCPTQFIRSQQEATSILNAAVVGLHIHHRQAQKGMLHFLERFCELPRVFGDSSENLQLCRSLLELFSSKIIQSVLNLLCGRATAFAIDEANGCVCDLLWELRKQIGNQIFEVIIVFIFSINFFSNSLFLQ